MSCPLDCEYLREARRHEKPLTVDPEQIPNRDVRVSEDFLVENGKLVAVLAYAVAGAAIHNPGAADADAREALRALIRTYRTLESGVYYESRPDNLLATAVFAAAQEAVTDFRRAEREDLGMSRTRDSDILKALVFLERVGISRNNGRARGRAFLDALRTFPSGGARPEPTASGSLVLP